MNILYITSRLPIPPLVKGDTLRDYYLIRALSQKGHHITLVSFYRGNENTDLNFHMLEQYCTKVRLVKFNRIIYSVNLLQGLYSFTPFQVLLYQSNKFKSIIHQELTQYRYDAAYVHFARLGEYLKEYSIPKILDLQDSFEKNMKDRYKKEKNPGIKLIALFESQKMKAYEKSITKKYDYASVISQRDIEPFHSNTHIIPNGVADLPTVTKEKTEGKSIIFWGNMGYFPNQDGAVFLIKQVMPLVWHEDPTIHVYIVGSKPSLRLRYLSSQKVTITGFVPNLQPYIEKATIAVVPLRFGTGTQNKVLEGMQMGIAQIATPAAVAGLENISQEVLISQPTAQILAQNIHLLINNPAEQEKLIQKGREYVQSMYSWDRSVAVLEDLFSQAIIRQHKSIEREQVSITNSIQQQIS